MHLMSARDIWETIGQTCSEEGTLIYELKTKVVTSKQGTFLLLNDIIS